MSATVLIPIERPLAVLAVGQWPRSPAAQVGTDKPDQ